MEHQSSAQNSKAELKYRRKKNAEEMRHQVVSFALMIFLTLVAFVAVSYDGFSRWFTIPFILLLAVIQIIFQLYYFMHMKHKDHGTTSLFLYTGLMIGIATVLAFITIVWV